MRYKLATSGMGREIRYLLIRSLAVSDLQHLWSGRGINVRFLGCGKLVANSNCNSKITASHFLLIFALLGNDESYSELDPKKRNAASLFFASQNTVSNEVHLTGLEFTRFLGESVEETC